MPFVLASQIPAVAAPIRGANPLFGERNAERSSMRATPEHHYLKGERSLIPWGSNWAGLT
jgi:hypothetical protein